MATLGWGSAVVLTRALLTSVLSTSMVVTMRFGVGDAILLVVFRSWRRFGSSNPRQWARGAVLGVLALGLPNVLFTVGLDDIPASLGASSP